MNRKEDAKTLKDENKRLSESNMLLDAAVDSLVDERDTLLGKLVATDEAFEEIIRESGKVDIKNWPAQQQKCQSIARQAISKENKAVLA